MAMTNVNTVRLRSAAVSRSPAAIPFLKWAGGKRQLLPELRRFVPEQFTGYIEPFLGSGAFFFDLAAHDRLRDKQVRLIDSNADLIGTYTSLAREPERVIEMLRDLAHQHERLGDEFYYEVRDRRFNPHRLRLRGASAGGVYPSELAAQLLYLNRTCFNGLFRLNRKGDFNVPVGRYAHPRICDAPNLMRVSALLRQPNVFMFRDSFQQVRETAEPGDFIYFDPPYAPVSDTAHFRSYTAEGFSEQQQEQLQRLIIELARRGCRVLLSNSVAPQITTLYESNLEARRAGLRTFRRPARRAINSNATSRGAVEEYLISNVTPVCLVKRRPSRQALS
jgi:DNA adenine methylase